MRGKIEQKIRLVTLIEAIEKEIHEDILNYRLAKDSSEDRSSYENILKRQLSAKQAALVEKYEKYKDDKDAEEKANKHSFYPGVVFDEVAKYEKENDRKELPARLKEMKNIATFLDFFRKNYFPETPQERYHRELAGYKRAKRYIDAKFKNSKEYNPVFLGLCMIVLVAGAVMLVYGGAGIASGAGGVNLVVWGGLFFVEGGLLLFLLYGKINEENANYEEDIKNNPEPKLGETNQKNYLYTLLCEGDNFENAKAVKDQLINFIDKNGKLPRNAEELKAGHIIDEKPSSSHEVEPLSSEHVKSHGSELPPFPVLEARDGNGTPAKDSSQSNAAGKGSVSQ